MKLFALILSAVGIISLSLWIGLFLYVTNNDVNIFKSFIDDAIGIAEIKENQDMSEAKKIDEVTSNIDMEKKYGILGTVGDFFNIATSFASVLTVILVSYGVYLQKVEIKGLRNGLEVGEKINRTITLIDMWNATCKTENNKDGVERFLNNISLLYNKGYKDKFDFNLIIKIIYDHPVVKYKISHMAEIKKELEITKETLRISKLDLEHFKKKNYGEESLSSFERLHKNIQFSKDESSLNKKITENEAESKRKSDELHMVETIKNIIEKSS